MSLLRFMKMKVFSPTLYISFENKEANEIRRLDRFTEKRRNSIGKRDRSRPDFKILQAYLSGYFPVKLSDFLSICFSLTLQGWLVSPCHLERSAGLKCNILGIRLEMWSDISWIYGAVCWFFFRNYCKNSSTSILTYVLFDPVAHWCKYFHCGFSPGTCNMHSLQFVFIIKCERWEKSENTFW